MRTVQLNAKKLNVLKLSVFLLLAVLVVSFLASNLESYAYSDGSYNVDTVSAKNVYDKVGVLGNVNVLPQTGNITPATLISLLGLASIATGGTVFTILKKKYHGTNN